MYYICFRIKFLFSSYVLYSRQVLYTVSVLVTGYNRNSATVVEREENEKTN